MKLTKPVLLVCLLAAISCESRDHSGSTVDGPPEGEQQPIIRVLNPDLTPIRKARVILAYAGQPSPPEFVTDVDGVAVISSEVAEKGGWESIDIRFIDEGGIEHGMSHFDSHPTFPLTLTVP